MQQQALPRSGGIALRQGLIFGVGLGIIQAIFSIINILTILPRVASNIILIISLVLAVLAYLFAGLRASQQTGRVVTGLLAGLWTGLFAAIISYAVTLIYYLANVDAIRIATQATLTAAQRATITNSLLIAGVLVVGVVEIVLYTVFGLGVGAIGGAIGRRRANIPSQAYQEAMFQPPPPPPNYQ